MPISVDKPKTTEQKHEQSSTSPQQTRCRQSDCGSQILPCMEFFVTLVRRIKRPRLLQNLVERTAGAALPAVAAAVDMAEGPLAIDARNALFHAVAKLAVDVRRFIERVVLLDDEYGAQAVESVLNESDAAILGTPVDRYGRALYLFLRQELPEAGTKREQRLDKVEHLQVMHRQCKSEDCSCHYFGPIGVVPKIDANALDMLRQRIAALFPQVDADQILIDQFTRRDLSHADRCCGATADEAAPVLRHTLTANFNGSTTHFLKVANGQLVEYEETVAMSARFSWEPGTGVLGVFCENHGVCHELVSIFGDVMLACADPINRMSMREFDLNGFSTPAMLERIEQECVAEIEKISVLQIKLARPFREQTTDEVNGCDLTRHLSSALFIGRGRRDA